MKWLIRQTFGTLAAIVGILAGRLIELYFGLPPYVVAIVAGFALCHASHRGFDRLERQP